MITVLALVYDITRNYEKTVQRYQDRTLIVHYCAPWCHECAALADFYEDRSNEVDKRQIVFAKADCIQIEQKCIQEGVKDFPTFAAFVRGRKEVYDGSNLATELGRWLNDVIGHNEL